MLLSQKSHLLCCRAYLCHCSRPHNITILFVPIFEVDVIYNVVHIIRRVILILIVTINILIILVLVLILIIIIMMLIIIIIISMTLSA